MKSFLIVIIWAFIFKPVLPIAGFIINYDYIKSELCENRTRPALHCNGSCFLKKELAKTAQDTPSISTLSNSIAFPFQWLLFPPQTTLNLIQNTISNFKRSHFNPLYALYHFHLISVLFRPPVCL